MWFKRKPRNRRLGREQVLDVRLRSSQVRAGRRRFVALTLGAIFAAGFGLYLLYRAGGWALDQLVYENKAFSLQELDVQTDGAISTDQLRRWAGVHLEDNLLALDLARVKRDLELVPLIQSVSVERILPHTLRIRIAEREPVAQINLARPRPNESLQLAVYLVDAEGWVMLPLADHQRATPRTQPADQYPVLSGLDANVVQPGHRIATPQAQAALKLIVTFEQSSMAGVVDLKRIEVSSPEVLVATTGQGSEVTFGLADLDQQLRRWHDIFDMGQKLGKAIATLDLAVSNHIPARWLEASAVPPATPKSPKPLRNRKKHV
jgi:cell division septal protein FtsQ